MSNAANHSVFLQMPSPKISVIVPVYNTEKYLRRCVDSILAQTFTDFELLLIDDGSTDTSGAICDEYASADSRVRVFHKPNGGVSSARNLGLDNAQGEWIAFADSDDYVEHDWLSSMVSLIHADCDLVCCGFQIHKADCSSIIGKGVSYNGNNTGLVDLLKQTGMEGSLWNKLFRLSIIKSHNMKFNLNFIFREDEEFFFRYLVLCKKCASTDSPMYHYYEPDWIKYQAQWNSPVSFYLVSSIYDSYRKLKVCNEDLRSELDHLLMYILWKQPRKIYNNIAIYRNVTGASVYSVSTMLIYNSIKSLKKHNRI